jgi:SAM-dependent methyltransferase
MNSYTPRKYWSSLAENYRHEDQTGFSPILHPGAPLWFNRQIDSFQERAWLRALSLCELWEKASVLDVGCGTGRWLRRYSRLGYCAIGADGSLSMLHRALELETETPLVAAELQSLPFGDETFDCVSAITVIQHIPEAEQQKAIQEVVRVVRRGGYLILLEVIRDQALHVFSHRPAEWVERVRSCGLELISWFGEEFLLFDRMLTRAVSLAKNLFSGTKESRLPVLADVLKPRSKFSGLTKGMYWQARRLSVGLSVYVERLADRKFPADWATHAVLVFRKPAGRP